VVDEARGARGSVESPEPALASPGSRLLPPAQDSPTQRVGSRPGRHPRGRAQRPPGRAGARRQRPSAAPFAASWPESGSRSERGRRCARAPARRARCPLGLGGGAEGIHA
jgi:hypothetical protein